MSKQLEEWRSVAIETSENLLTHLRLASLEPQIPVTELLKLCTAFRTLTDTMSELERETEDKTIHVIMSSELEGYAK